MLNVRRIETTKISDTNYSLVLKINQLLRQKGTYDLTDLRKILDHKCQYPLDALVKQEDFHFVPKWNGPLNPSLALCVGRMTVGTYQTEGPDLYIMDVSDGKKPPPDLHCRADTYMNDELGGLRISTVMSDGTEPQGTNFGSKPCYMEAALCSILTRTRSWPYSSTFK